MPPAIFTIFGGHSLSPRAGPANRRLVPPIYPWATVVRCIDD